MGDPRYRPTGILAQVRQHPRLARTDQDRAALEAAAKKQADKAAKRAAEAPPSELSNKVPSKGKQFAGAEERRLHKRRRKLGI